jgi:hypothetical protein
MVLGTSTWTAVMSEDLVQEDVVLIITVLVNVKERATP